MTPADRLSEARLALHQLLTGTSVVRVQRDGRQVEFTPATARSWNATSTNWRSKLAPRGRCGAGRPA